MTTDLARRDNLTGLSIAEMQDVSNLLAQSGMFSDKKSAAQVFVAVLAGQELGIPPFAAINGVHVIQGKPSVGAGLLAAMVKQSGKYDYQVKRLDDEGCTLHFFENGTGVGPSTFTIKDAERAGLTRNPTWKQYPRNMLFARALSSGVSWYCPDVTHGQHIDSDPIADSTPRPPATSPSPPPVEAAPTPAVEEDAVEVVVDAEVIPDTPSNAPATDTPPSAGLPGVGDASATSRTRPAESEPAVGTSEPDAPSGTGAPAELDDETKRDLTAQFGALSRDETAELKRLLEANQISLAFAEVWRVMQGLGVITLDGLMRALQERRDGAQRFADAIENDTLQDRIDEFGIEGTFGEVGQVDPPIPGQVAMPETQGKGRRKLTPKAVGS